ncbi:MAG: hypothetical protein ABR909_02745 [Candidatus Bathyarchaeia archaeon]|jgi:hypothetical protein
MKTSSPIKKKEYSGKGSLRDLSVEGAVKEEFFNPTFLKLKENECVAIVHPDGSVDQVCRIEKHYVANPLLEK